MKYNCITDRGTVRSENQDCVFITEVRSKSCLAAVVCDGMGGAHGGKLASELAVSAYMAELRRVLIEHQEKKPDFAPIMDAACKAANDIVYGYSISNTENAGMGTTLVAVTIRGRNAEIINIGDSRAYLIERKKISQITLDHSVVQGLVARGDITPEEARYHPQKHLITRAIGVDPVVEADHYHVHMRLGSKLLSSLAARHTISSSMMQLPAIFTPISVGDLYGDSPIIFSNIALSTGNISTSRL